MEAWFKLLLHNNARRRFGLSIPFMIGCTQQPPGTRLTGPEVRDALRSLLVAMRDTTPEAYVIRIAECDRLREPVAAPIMAGYGFPDCVGIPQIDGRRTALFVGREYMGDGRDIEVVEQAIWRLNEEPLTTGNYSKRGGQWLPFNGDDVEFALSAAAYPDEDM